MRMVYVRWAGGGRGAPGSESDRESDDDGRQTMAGIGAGGSDYPPLDVEALRTRIAGLMLGRPLIYLPVVGSTNTHALGLARAGAADGTLVLSDEQPEGRGRAGRVWRSMPRRQVLCSLVLRPEFPAHFLVMAAALAVARAVEDVAEARPDIKWPNDVLMEGRKLCGILIETGTDDQGHAFAVLGIGLNVNGTLAGDPELAERASTLEDVAGHPLQREEVAAALLAHLDALYTRLSTGGEAALREVRAVWRARLVTLGRPVRIVQGQRVQEGVAEDVDEGGALLLRQSDGRLLTITWGDVS